jgi:endonuclease/exonuclease/phosphatase (EEP) superfamily protein YafD
VHLDHIPKERHADGRVRIAPESTLKSLYREVFTETARSASAKQILEWLEQDDFDHVIVGGDFNTVPVSRTILRMENGLDDALWPGPSYPVNSYVHIAFPTMVRIDYLFHSPGMAACAGEVVQKTIGDHYPVRAQFSFRNAGDPSDP